MTHFPHTTPCVALKWCAIEGTVNVLWGRGNVSSAASIAQARHSAEHPAPVPVTTLASSMQSICVYSYDANPETDPHKFRTSRHDALARVELGSCVYISDTAIQERPPANWRHYDSASRFDEAWRVEPSAGVSVWQMRSQMGMSKDYVNE